MDAKVRLLSSILMVCLLWSCNGKKVADNTYAPLGDYSVVVSDEFTYLGDMHYFRNVYRSGKKQPHAKRRVNASVFIRTADPRQLLLITRWSASCCWATPDWASRDVDGVSFWEGSWLNCIPNDSIGEFVFSKEHAFLPSEAYRYVLRKNIARATQFNIELYVEKTQFRSDECPKVKEYLRKLMDQNITLKKQ